MLVLLVTYIRKHCNMLQAKLINRDRHQAFHQLHDRRPFESAVESGLLSVATHLHIQHPEVVRLVPGIIIVVQGRIDGLVAFPLDNRPAPSSDGVDRDTSSRAKDTQPATANDNRARHGDNDLEYHSCLRFYPLHVPGCTLLTFSAKALLPYKLGGQPPRSHQARALPITALL
jgi:hypothetical protein